MEKISSTVPMTIICSKATEDIKKILLGVQKEHDLPADLMCMILRDVSAYFERERANDYTNAIVQQMAAIEELKKENEALKQTSQLFDSLEGSNDNSINQS